MQLTPRQIVYLVLAAAGLVLTWTFNLRFMAESGGACGFVKDGPGTLSVAGEVKLGGFITVYDGFQDKAKWQQHVFPAVNARYVKIIIDYPNSGPTQLGELECEVGTALLGKLAAGASAAGGGEGGSTAGAFGGKSFSLSWLIST